jgi:hypothetical protein
MRRRAPAVCLRDKQHMLCRRVLLLDLHALKQQRQEMKLFAVPLCGRSKPCWS